MLNHLSVKNLAIVEEAAVGFGGGLNIITGETGAGKSVLMGALDLVLGGRADKSAIREGAAEANVEAVFALADTSAADLVLAEGGLPVCEEGALLIRRTISATGSGRCFVNDAPTTVQTLRKLGCHLVDIHGPYDHQSLLDPAFQRQVLDAYGQCGDALNAYSEIWRDRNALRQRLAELQDGLSNVAEEIDRLQFITDEITRAALTEADEEELVRQHAEAANAEQILSLGTVISNALTDGESSAFDLLVSAQAQLADLAHILPEAAEWKSDTQSVVTQLQEIGRALSQRLSQIEAEPERLQQLEDRMALVQRLKRKYGGSVSAVLATSAKSQARLDDLATRSEQILDVSRQIDAATRLLTERAAHLTRVRTSAAAKLAKAIVAELRDLGFLKSGFAVDLAPAEPEPHGADDIAFGFAPNPGEPMRPLRAIASSGEISRVMLAVKAVLAAHDSIPVLVFDEIDANIGGEVGRAVGQKLRRVAQTHQVISITHLPQSAVYGHQHYVVSKDVVKGRT
ncbi:MAG: DNA repair protein RecN, partial [Kiritimatiellaeota bacterium]|nr:DNA repair protein RecN [Kiritimatiellota bacterium]